MRKIIILIIICVFLFVSCRTSKDNEEYGKFTKVQTIAGLDNKIGEPFGIAYFNDLIYVSDGQNGKIWKITKDGKSDVLTDKLDTPSQIVIDKNGDLIVADSGNHTIKKVFNDGSIQLIAGTENKKGFADGDAKTALFNAPIGVAVVDDKIYVADTYNDKIRLIENGKVSTIAGSETGFADGADARFNLPTGLAVWTVGRILVADTENSRIRVVEKNGNIWTLSGNANQNLKNGSLREAEFVYPTAITVDKFGAIYVADGNAIRVIGRRFFPLVETISNDGTGFLDDIPLKSRFNRPSGLGVDEKGNLFVADSENQLVRVFTNDEMGKTVSAEEFAKIQISAEEFRKLAEPRWTYNPPDATREIAGTLGEIRGYLENEDSRVHFHNGLDITGNYGETAIIIRDEKVLRPNAVQNFETTRELIRLPTIGYIHIRLGRNAEQIPFDDDRFQFVLDEDEKPSGVRIPRGTKFKAGDAIGTLNRFNHVHLIAGRTGREMNALDALLLPGISDSRTPQITEVSLFNENWKEFETEKGSKRITLNGKVRIVVQAFDQMDGNSERRKLGLYKIGYQILDENNDTLAEYQKPKWNIIFDKTPEREAVRLVYARGSKSGATGETIFNYIATNEVSGKFVRENFFDINKLEPGNYTVRVFAADFFGNTASEDLEIKID